MAADTVLSLQDICISLILPDGRQVDAVQDVSFDIARGEVLGLIGESGTGKSMLGRAIMSALPGGFHIRQGRIRLGGQDITRIDAAGRRQVMGREIAMIPQDPQSALSPVQTIGAHLREHLARLGHQGDRNRAAQEMLETVQIANPAVVMRKYPHEISGGMCQRVLIAMAFAARPRVIIADEATTALDPISQANVVRLLRQLQTDHGTAVVFITHDLRLASHVCDNVMVLFGGQPLEYGPAKAVIEAPAHPYTHSLLRAIPSLEGALERLPRLPDFLPSLASFAGYSGCRFAPRAERPDPVYRIANPAPRLVGAGHWARWLASDAAELRSTPVPVTRPAPSDQPLLQVSGLRKHFTRSTGLLRRQHHVVPAAEDVGFSLAAGEILGVVGLSGSGKSTLARLLVGLETPDAGAITLGGVDLLGHSPEAQRQRREQVQMVFQNPQSSLNPRRTIGNLVTQAHEGMLPRLSRSARRQKAATLLRDVGLSEAFLDRYPGQLSGGQRQRVGIARALCVQPRLIVADEVVSGLDVSVQAQVLNLLLDLRDSRGISVIFITHDLSVVRYLCDRVLVMKHGRVVDQGATETVLQTSTVPETRALIEAIPPEDPHRIWRLSAA